jgi:integrase
MPMRKLAENWLVQMREDDDRAIQTIQRYEATLKNSILPKIGELTIRELTNGRPRLLIKSLARSGRVSDARIARTVIRRVLAHGVENSVGSADTFNFDGLTLSVPHKVSRAITTGELRELWQLIDTDRAKVRPGPRSTKAHDDLEDALLIVFATSLRISEVLAITADRVDFKTGVLKIEAKIEYKLGAGYREGPVKTKSTARDIPLPTYALEILEQRLAYGGMAFATSRGKPLSQNNLRRTLRACLEEHELGTWFSFHQARKAVASVVFDALGAEVAALVLGHGDGGNLIRSTYGARNPVAPNVTHLTERFARRNVGS